MGSRVQVLVATMNQLDHSLVEKMNIQSDAIIGNQCSVDWIDRYVDEGKEIIYLNFNERGVGLNRNNAWMRATGEICLFADDDITYIKDYATIIEKCFDDIPQADVIVFNLQEPDTNRYVIRRTHRVRYYNCMRYGAVRIAVRTRRVREQGVFFNLCFGGGTEHSCGEDTLFLIDCLKRGLKVYAVPVTLLKLKEARESTWFKGYTDEFFYDKGFLYGIISKRWRKMLCLQDAVRHKKKYKRPWREIYRLMRG